MYRLRAFLRDERAAVTSDWLMLVIFIGLVMTIFVSMTNASRESQGIGDRGVEIRWPFGSERVRGSDLPQIGPIHEGFDRFHRN